jgi:hypothetical protein
MVGFFITHGQPQICVSAVEASAWEDAVAGGTYVNTMLIQKVWHTYVMLAGTAAAKQ